VLRLKNALAWTGHYPVEKAHLGVPTTDEDLNWGLRGFQRDYGLKTDGFSRPGGATEARINQIIKPMIQLAAEDERVSQNQAQHGAASLKFFRQERKEENIYGGSGGSGNDPEIIDEREEQPDHGSEFKGEDKRAASVSSDKMPSLTDNRERRDAIVNNTPATFPIAENPDADGDKPWFEWPAMSEVGEYQDLIEKEAEEAGVDPDLVKAIVYMETTHGYYDRIKDAVSEPGSLRPMNVNVEYWEGMGVSREQLKNPELNIRTGIKIVKGISERLKHGDIRKIATLYNNLAVEKVTDYGARVERLYRERPWENE